MQDPVGKKLVAELRKPKRVRYNLSPHSCYWGKVSNPPAGCSIPTPRALCSHGLVAPIPPGTVL